MDTLKYCNITFSYWPLSCGEPMLLVCISSKCTSSCLTLIDNIYILSAFTENPYRKLLGSNVVHTSMNTLTHATSVTSK